MVVTSLIQYQLNVPDNSEWVSNLNFPVTYVIVPFS